MRGVEGEMPALPVNARGFVNPGDLRKFLVEIVKQTGLNGFKPADGKAYGVDGSAESWADFFVALCEQESDYRATTTGDVGLFRGNSNGLFQLSPDDALNHHLQDKPYTLTELQQPEFNARAAVLIAEHLMKTHESIRTGIGLYWGPVKRGWKP